MPRIDDCSRDQDFQPPAERSFDEIVQGITARLPCEIWTDADLVADLQLYILVSLGMGKTQSMVDDELVACGLPIEDATRLAKMCLRMGYTAERQQTTIYQIDSVTIEATMRQNTDAARLDSRADPLRARAARIVDDLAGDRDEFRFVGRVNLMPPSDRFHRRVRVFLALTIILGIALLAFLNWIGVIRKI